MPCVMARHYSREELLKLKESPLVAKPAGLPPTEEWMGPLPDPEARHARSVPPRAKRDDGVSTDASTGRRPTFEARAKSSTVPEDIVLGPPKTAFVSASGRNGQRPGQSNQDDEPRGKGRSVNRDSYRRDAQGNDRDEVNTRDSRNSQYSNRRSVKDDPDMWSNIRQPRKTDEDDNDRFPKRNGEWDNNRNKDSRGERRDRETGDFSRPDRRGVPSRSQDAPLWAQDAGLAGGSDAASERSRNKGAGVRDQRGRREQNQGWGRGAPQDEDPLWLDGDEIKEEKKHAPTQADFEEFRAKMKAQNSKLVVSPPTESRLENTPPEPGPAFASAKKKPAEALDFSDFSDRFYDILSQPKKQQEVLHEESRQDLMHAAAKMAKPSKFSSLFNTESTAKQPIVPPLQDAVSEDKAGFQRILKLLSQDGEQQQSTFVEQALPQMAIGQNSAMSPPAQSPPAKQHDELRSPPPDHGSKPKDREFLLNLMRQPTQNHPDHSRPNVNLHRNLDHQSAISSFSNLAMSPPQETSHQMPPSAPPPGFFDESARHEFPTRDKLNPTAPTQRAVPPGLYDQFNNSQRSLPSGLPPGLERRPPGFDHLPPGFGQPSPQRQGMPPPPPGFPPPQRGPGGLGSGMFPSRPNGAGMPPPPGFINMGGPPPPGFMGFGHDGPGLGANLDLGQGYPPQGHPRR